MSAVDLMMRSRHIYLLGLHSAASISMHFEDALNLFMPNTTLFPAGVLFDHVLNMTPDDVVIFISTRPCTKRTVEFAQLCHKYKIPIILITNSTYNPISSLSTNIINTGTVDQTSEHISTLIVVQAFIEESGKRYSPQSATKLNLLNDFFKANHLVLLDKD